MELVAESSNADAEDMGRFGPIVVLVGKCLEDEPFFHLVQSDARGEADGWGDLFLRVLLFEAEVFGVEDF